MQYHAIVLHFLIHNLTRRRLFACDTCVPFRISLDLMMLLVVTNGAANTTWLIENLLLDGALVTANFLLTTLLLLGFRHADKPVQSKGSEDIEDAVRPEDTLLVLVVVQ
jgi:hypothetical protein